MADSAQSNRSAQLSVTVLAAAYLVLAWAGNASIAAWNAHGYPYNDQISFIGVGRDMLLLPIGDVLFTAANENAFPFLNTIMLVSFVLAAIALWSGPLKRGMLITASVIVVPFGLLGLMSLLGVVRDGEWLAEGWSLLEAFSVWSVFLWLFAGTKLRQPANGLQTAPAA